MAATGGVRRWARPREGKEETVAYGVQIQNQSRTLVMATFAIFISALSSLLPADLRLSTFIFLAWAFRAASWATTAFTMEL